jgi:hypothetical protein
MAGLSYLAAAPPVHVTKVEFTGDGKLKLPDGYREWVYVGASVTPNDLNGGEALFPECHSVYIDPESFARLPEDWRVSRRHSNGQGTGQRWR